MQIKAYYQSITFVYLSIHMFVLFNHRTDLKQIREAYFLLINLLPVGEMCAAIKTEESGFIQKVVFLGPNSVFEKESGLENCMLPLICASGVHTSCFQFFPANNPDMVLNASMKFDLPPHRGVKMTTAWTASKHGRLIA